MTFPEIRMGPWRPLYDYFARNRSEQAVGLSYEQVQSLVGLTLPREALMVPTWWTVLPTKQRARSWLAADRHPRAYEAGVDFVRVSHLAAHSPSDQRLRRRLLDRNAVDHLSVTPNPADSELRWWKPHDVYVIHFPDAHVVKVGLTRSGSRRIHEFRGAGGVLIRSHSTANRWAATVIEGDYLALSADARTEPPLWLAQTTGFTEFWSDAFGVPDARAVKSLGALSRLPGWNYSI